MSWRWLWGGWLVIVSLIAGPSAVADEVQLSLLPKRVGVQEVANAITELSVAEAHDLLTGLDTNTPAIAYQRARLAVYVGDCDTAEAILATLAETPESARLLDLARRCARATAGGHVVEDRERGVWIRFQDSEDEVLAPLLFDVAERARRTMYDDLGIELPRPLRIDLVRDLFSLAAVSGLPLEAAETTGTVAVARWGRVTMLSPRAARLGYPWQDTLAHEITHLVLSRGSRDFAPLWLQEGIAKREEARWRPERPHDARRNADTIAKDALVTGRSIGIDKIGPSIAMLPTAADARISYAEVESFMNFWIEQNGRGAFTLLMFDLKGMATRQTDDVMQSVTGYPLSYWIGLWKKHLLDMPATPADEVLAEDGSGDVVQSVRLGDLLSDHAHVAHAGEYFDRALERASDKSAIRFRAAASQLALGNGAEAQTRLGTLDDVSSLHGGWLGVHGRLLLEKQRQDEALAALSVAVAIDPYGEAAACEGHVGRTRATTATDTPLPEDPVRRRLCEAARKIVRH